MNSANLVAWMRSRLSTQVPALRVVSGAADFQRATEDLPKATPAAYVFSAEESADEGGFDQPTIQRLRITVVVVLVVRQVADTTGAAASIDIDILRADVWAALHGARPDADHEPLTFASGGIVSFRDGLLWWSDTWSSATYVVSQ